MDTFLDTNILLRHADPGHAQHAVSFTAVQLLRERGDLLFVASQNLVEFWNVATRPLERNGFGRSASEAFGQLQHVEESFKLLSDHPDVYQEWRRLVTTKGVMGVQVHDARLVATMKVYGISHILTFNTADFRRYASEGIVTVHPDSV